MSCGRWRSCAPRCSCGCGRTPPRARPRASGSASTRHLRRRHLVAVRQHPHQRRGSGLARVGADGGAGRHHGALPRGARLRRGALAPRRGAACAGSWRCRRPGCSWSGGAAGFFRASRGCRSATPRPTRGSRAGAGGGGVRHQRSAAARRRRAHGARLRHAAGADRGPRRAGPSLGCRGGAAPALLDPAVRAPGVGRGHPGRHPPGSEVARRAITTRRSRSTRASPSARSARSSSSGRSPPPPTPPTTSFPISRAVPRSARSRLRTGDGGAARGGWRDGCR